MIRYILAVNPGFASTKIAVFRNREECALQDIEHDQRFWTAIRYRKNSSFRRDMVLNCLNQHFYKAEQLSAVVGRAGFCRL